MPRVEIAINPSSETHCGNCRHVSDGEFVGRTTCRIFHDWIHEDAISIPGDLEFGPKGGLLRRKDCVEAEKKARQRTRK